MKIQTKKKFKKWIIRLSLLGSIFLFLLILASILSYYIFIIKAKPEVLERSYIMSTISSESPIYFNDGHNLMGVYFSKSHRKYLSFDEIPDVFKKALIASEDKNFYSHFGLDFKGMVRAAVVNFKARKVVQGASTLTQLAIRNITFRSKRDFTPKIMEMINAIRMEHIYSKDEILEFIINQFFVNSNGRGLHIASKYFFSKEAKDLTLVEAAFIAGAFKGPNRYNPDFYSTEENKKKAYVRAVERKNYVIRNMYKVNAISKAEMEEALKAEIDFNFGRFSYENNILIDMVSKELESDKIKDFLNEAGIENISTSGIKIFTTIDYNLQQAAVESLRKGLELAEVKLNSYEKPIKDYKPRLAEIKIATVLNNNYVLDQKEDKKTILFNLDDEQGLIDPESLLEFTQSDLENKNGIWVSANEHNFKSFLKKFKKGDNILVSLARHNTEGELPFYNLRMDTKLDGGLIAIDGNKIVSIAGGYDNKDFNRAIMAKRQPGSVFKLLVYLAAFQLGWSNIDMIPNIRTVFPFQNQFYIPKPDHAPQTDEVSISWAGVKSENLATVYLLYNLLDYLNFDEFIKLCGLLDLAKNNTESDREYFNRLRDKHGILISKEKFTPKLFNIAIRELYPEYVFDGREKEARYIKSLAYGTGFNEEIENILAELDALKKLSVRGKLKQKKYEEKYNKSSEKIPFLLDNYIRYKNAANEIVKAIQDYKSEKSNNKQLKLEIAVDDDLQRNIIFKTDFYDKLRKETKVLNIVTSYPISIQQVLDEYNVEDIYIDGRVKLSSIFTIDENLKTLFADLINDDYYSLKALYYHQDFRTYLALKYVVNLAYRLGIKTRLDEVLSFPLGSNSVSLDEIALAYQTMTRGVRYFTADDIDWSLTLISKIEDRNGNVIYRNQERSVNVVDYRLVDLINQILGNVVKYGTGIRLDRQNKIKLSLDDADSSLFISVPFFGKTGTTNNYINSTFAGFIPYLKSKNSLNANETLVVASYMGYDNNKRMANKKLKISGATGAMPIWGNFANYVVSSDNYSKNINPYDYAFEGAREIEFLPLSSDRCKLPVNIINGQFMDPKTEANVYEEYYGDCDNDEKKPKRLFTPIYKEFISTY
ncbi:MAG: transglycosylase domain-containing protein [Pseudomonadota bacterium]